MSAPLVRALELQGIRDGKAYPHCRLLLHFKDRLSKVVYARPNMSFVIRPSIGAGRSELRVKLAGVNVHSRAVEFHVESDAGNWVTGRVLRQGETLVMNAEGVDPQNLAWIEPHSWNKAQKVSMAVQARARRVEEKQAEVLARRKHRELINALLKNPSGSSVEWF